MRRRLIFLLVACVLAGCEHQDPPGFVVLAGAEGVKMYYVRGLNKGLYRLNAEFPAEKIIQDISGELDKLGWEPLDKLYLYPEEPSGKVQGWTFYEQAKKTGWMVYEWSTDWKDKDNNIVSYALQYRDPIEKYRQGTFIMRPGNDILIVNFVFMPAEVAENVRETVKPKTR